MGRSEVVRTSAVVLGALLMAAAVAMVFLYAPRETTMGDVQRIFYFHVASAWVGFAAFLVTCAAGIAYLIDGQRRWDRLALASVEIGLAFMVAAVVTGSLWARPVWGTYWTWEPRLTISAVQLLVYVAYLMLRSSSESQASGSRFAAVYGIAAAVTVPLSWFAIRWWRTIHPDMLTGGGGMAMTPRMLQTLLVAIAAFTALYALLLWQRIGLARTADDIEALRLQIEED
ncbi:MAG: cytochrome c biogenesis protein [Anaerolineae bacterium]